MILRIKGFDFEILIEENVLPVLVILDKPVFRSIINSIYENIQGNHNNDIVIENSAGKILNYGKKVVCIDEYFNIDFKTKEIISNLYKKIEEDITVDIDIKMKIETDIKSLGNFLFQYIDDIDFNISYNQDVSIVNVLKLFNFQINESEISLSIDKLISLITIYADFKIADLIIFVNLRAFYNNNNEIREVYKVLSYKKIKFICIETLIHDMIDEESVYLIDEDLVESCYTK